MSGIKVVFLGPQACGKTSIINRVVHDNFEESYMGTVGVDFSTHRNTLDDGKEVSLQIWDTAGQERFYSILPAYIRTALGVFLVFDITDPESFMSMRSWYQLVMNESGSDPVLVVVGNKLDLEDERRVTVEEAERFSTSIHAEYVEASAKTSRGIDSCMRAMSTALTRAGESRLGVLKANNLETVVLTDGDGEGDQNGFVCHSCY